VKFLAVKKLLPTPKWRNYAQSGHTSGRASAVVAEIEKNPYQISTL
jgi:hypothetical protein